MEQIFEFLIFSGKMAKCVQNFGHFANFVQYFGHISKKQKNMDQKHQILTKFLPYISIEKLWDGQGSKLNNFLTQRYSLIA